MNSNLVYYNGQYVGRNLFGFNKDIQFRGGDIDRKINGFICGKQDTYSYRVISNFTNSIPGYYTVSGYIYTDSTDEVSISMHNASASNVSGSLLGQVKTTNTPVRFEFTYYIEETDELDGCFMLNIYKGVSYNTYIKDFKIERGKQATPWCPALEDTLEYIEPNLIKGTSSRWSNWITPKYNSENTSVELCSPINKNNISNFSVYIEVELRDVIASENISETSTRGFDAKILIYSKNSTGGWIKSYGNFIFKEEVPNGIQKIYYTTTLEKDAELIGVVFNNSWWASGQFRYRCLAVKEGKLPNPIWCKNIDEIKPNANLLEYYDNIPYITETGIYRYDFPLADKIENGLNISGDVHFLDSTDNDGLDINVDSYITLKNNYNYIANTTQSDNIKSKGYYVLSFYYRGESQLRINIQGKYFYISLNSEKWKKYSGIFYLEEGNYIYINNNSESPIDICGVKLEKGTKATKYLPVTKILNNSILYYDDAIILRDKYCEPNNSAFFKSNSNNTVEDCTDLNGISKFIRLKGNSYIERQDTYRDTFPYSRTLSFYAKGMEVMVSFGNTTETISINSNEWKRVKCFIYGSGFTNKLRIANISDSDCAICGIKIEPGSGTDYIPNNVEYLPIEPGDYVFAGEAFTIKPTSEYSLYCTNIIFNIDEKYNLTLYAKLPYLEDNIYIIEYSYYSSKISKAAASSSSKEDILTFLDKLVLLIKDYLHNKGYTDVKVDLNNFIREELLTDREIESSINLGFIGNKLAYTSYPLLKLTISNPPSYDDYIPESKFAGKFLDDSTESDWYYRDPNNGNRQSLVSITDVNTKLFDKDVGLDNHKGIFKDNTALEYIWIDFSQYGEEAFSGCTNLKQIVFTEGSVVRYATGLFNGCTSLQTLDVVNCQNINGATMLYFLAAENDNKIADCRSLTEIRFPENENGGYAEGNLDFSNNPLSRECAMRIVNSIIHKASYTLTFSKYTYDLLSEDDLATARSLWNIAYK